RAIPAGWPRECRCTCDRPHAAGSSNATTTRRTAASRPPGDRHARGGARGQGCRGRASMELAPTRRRDDPDVTHPHLKTPPLLVVAVPGDRRFQAHLERRLRRPAEHRPEPLGVGGMTEYLTWAIAEKLDAVFWHVHRSDHLSRDVEDRNVASRSD